MHKDAEIVVNGETVGHGITGMVNAFDRMLGRSKMNETETPGTPDQELPQPEPMPEPDPTPDPEPGPTDPPAEPDPNEPDPNEPDPSEPLEPGTVTVDGEEVEVPGAEEVPDAETLTPDDANADDTVDNAESESYPDSDASSPDGEE